MFERILAWYGPIHGIRSISLRYFNAAGAAYGIGERHEPETHANPAAARRRARQARAVHRLAWTTRRPTGAASATTSTSSTWRGRTCRRSSDCARRRRKPRCSTWNRRRTSVLEFDRHGRGLAGRRIDYRRAPPAPGTRRARRLVRARPGAARWSPSLTMRDILADALTWQPALGRLRATRAAVRRAGSDPATRGLVTCVRGPRGRFPRREQAVEVLDGPREPGPQGDVAPTPASAARSRLSRLRCTGSSGGSGCG